MATEAEQQTTTRREGRSPGYPYFSVEKAIERAGLLYKQEVSHWAPLSSATQAWNYSPKSSGGRQSVATMRYYGLIEVQGDGDARRIRVSDIAKRILLDEREDDTEKRLLIREVALSPTAHRTLYEEYKAGLPSDGTVLHFLMFSKGYNKEAARDLLDEFKQTASYIGLYEPHGDVDKPAQGEDKERTPPEVKVGDRVQATVNGQDMFPTGAMVLGLTEDGAWVFTDQAPGGLKREEITVLEAAQNPSATERPMVPPGLLASAQQARQQEETPTGTRKAVFPVSEGDVALIFPKDLSADGLHELGLYLQIFLKKEEAAAHK